MSSPLPPPGATAFAVLGLPERFEVDLRALDESWRRLSAQVHPDRVQPGDTKGRIAALEGTARLNAARDTLRSPARRAAALLLRHGIDLEAEGAKAHRMSPAFLLEILDLREALDDARAARDLDRALALQKQVKVLESASLARLTQGLGELPPPPEQLPRLADDAAALRYFQRFHDEVVAIEEEVAP